MEGERNKPSNPGWVGPIAILVLVNLLAHFLPFERASRSHDDLATFVAVQDVEPASMGRYLLSGMANAPDRPLSMFMCVLQLIAGPSQLLAVTLVFLTSSLLTIVVYAAIRELVGHRSLALWCALGYLLVPNKLEMYHTLDHANLNAVNAVYFASLFFFLRFAKTDRRACLAGSLLCYTVAIFWYELGFLLPVVLGVYALLFNRRKALSVSLFLVPAVAYLAVRTGIFGLVAHPVAVRPPQFEKVLSNLFVMFPQHYVGRYMAKSVLYGLYRFTTIQQPWLWIMLMADGIALYGGVRWMGRTSFPRVPGRVIALAAVMVVAFILPATVYWGVLDRHTALSSVGIAILAGAVMGRLRAHRVTIVTSLLGVALVACQGTAWSQVLAGRMNHAIYETLVSEKEHILKADEVLIDQYSFAAQVPYTWVRDPNNQLDTYWGVKALLGRGFPFLVQLAVGEKKSVHVVRSPIERRGDQLHFKVYNGATYQLEEHTVPRQGTVLIDYQRVYGDTALAWK